MGCQYHAPTENGADTFTVAMPRLTFGRGCLDEARTAEAHERNVFGSPSYVVNDEIFWGQDRLDFLERALA